MVARLDHLRPASRIASLATRRDCLVWPFGSLLRNLPRSMAVGNRRCPGKGPCRP